MALKISSNAIKVVSDKIQGLIENVKKRWIQRFVEAGNILIDTAKKSGNYEDRTGDLRDSIGFLVTLDGQMVAEDFSTSVGGEMARTKAMALNGGTTGLMLTVMVGMDYGSYVESQGFDVLASAGQIVNTLIPKLLKE